MQPLNPGLVNQNFAVGDAALRRPVGSSPAADMIDAFDDATDLGRDVRGEIATFFSDLC